MTDEVHGGDLPPITPREIKMYEQEYKHGAQLFKNALDQYSESDNPYQQAEFQKVMDKAMRILNETAAELNRKALNAQTEKIAKDYATFNDMPKDRQAVSDLQRDLDQAKRSIA